MKRQYRSGWEKQKIKKKRKIDDQNAREAMKNFINRSKSEDSRITFLRYYRIKICIIDILLVYIVNFILFYRESKISAPIY